MVEKSDNEYICQPNSESRRAVKAIIFLHIERGLEENVDEDCKARTRLIVYFKLLRNLKAKWIICLAGQSHRCKVPKSQFQTLIVIRPAVIMRKQQPQMSS